MRTPLAVAAIALFAACQSRGPIRPDAFDNGQKAALLSIQSPPRITIWAPPGTAGADFDAAPVLAELRPVLVEALAANPHFKLVPEAKVFAAPAYAAHPDAADPSGLVSPPGYKPVRDEALYPQLAREAGAEMGLAIALNLTYRAEDGAATVVLSVGAIDVKGRGVWKGGAAVTSDKGIDVRTAGPKGRSEAFKDAARKAMAQLEEGMSHDLAFETARGRTGR